MTTFNYKIKKATIICRLAIATSISPHSKEQNSGENQHGSICLPHGQFSAEAAQQLGQSFHTLKPSQYKDGAYRLRHYSKFDYQRSSGNIELQAGAQFVQSSDLNRFQGDITRTYDDLND